jgi:hypothetical protein
VNDPVRGGAVLEFPRGKQTVTSGKMTAYDPGPPAPRFDEYDDMPGEAPPIEGPPIDFGGDGPPF